MQWGEGYGRVPGLAGRAKECFLLHELLGSALLFSYLLYCYSACRYFIMYVYVLMCALQAAWLCTPCELALLAWGVILVVMSFVYIGREGRPLWKLLPFLKSFAIVLSLYYYQYYRTVPVIVRLFALFLLSPANSWVVTVSP